MCLQFMQHHGDVFRIMLSVCIDSQGILKTHLDGFSEPCRECLALTLVTLKRDDGYGKIQRAQQAQGVVCATVIDHDDVA